MADIFRMQVVLRVPLPVVFSLEGSAAASALRAELPPADTPAAARSGQPHGPHAMPPARRAQGPGSRWGILRDVSDPVLPNPGLGRRIDLLAVSKPAANRRVIWFAGLMAIWSAVGVASSIAVRHWEVAAIGAGTVVLAASTWWISLRAKRRVPETKRWLEKQVS